MKTTTTSSQIGKTNQAGLYRETLKAYANMEHSTLRIDIKADSHKPQGHATIERWNGSEWKPLASIFAAAMETDKDIAYRPHGPIAQDFSKDRETLLRLATEILG